MTPDVIVKSIFTQTTVAMLKSLFVRMW